MNTNNTYYKKNVLVTGGRAPVTLHLSRLLNNANCNVYIADSNQVHVSKFSNSVKKTFWVSKPRQETKKFIDELKHIIIDNNIDLLIPTCEEIFYISMYLSELKELCDVLCDSFEKLKIYHNKYTFIKRLESLNIKTPKTIQVTSNHQLKSVLNEIDYDVVLKPVFSRFSSQVLFIKKDSLKQMPVINISDDNPWIIQEMIQGTQFCTYTIANKGKILANSTYETKFTAGKGASISFQHDSNQEIYNWVEFFIKQENFNGQIAFDFIITDKNEIYPLECNPRATSGIHLFTNDNHIENALFDQTDKPIIPFENTKYMISSAMILYGLKSVNSISNFKKWLKVYKASKDVFFNFNDIKPFLGQFIVLARYFFQSLKLKISILEISTYDIEWNGEEIK